jgi:hypothetical protein
LALVSESATVLPIHRKILAFTFVGWIFDFYDLLLLSFLVASTSLTTDLGLTRYDVSLLLGTALVFTAVGGLLGGALADRFGRKPLLMITIVIYSVDFCRTVDRCGRSWQLGRSPDSALAVNGPLRTRSSADVAARAGTIRVLPPERIGIRRFFATLVRNFWRPDQVAVEFMLCASSAPRRADPACAGVGRLARAPARGIRRAACAGQGRRADAWAGSAHDHRPALMLTTFTWRCWFKTIWLPTYFTRFADSRRRLRVAFFMDQCGSVAGAPASVERPLRRRPSFFVFGGRALGLVTITFRWDLIAGTVGPAGRHVRGRVRRRN